MKNLVDRLGGLQERKDVHGITTVVDRHATLALAGKPHTCADDVQRVRFALRIILSGAPMFADRLAKAGLIEDDTCDHPDCKGARCTAAHWFFECRRNQHNIDKLNRINDDPKRKHQSSAVKSQLIVDQLMDKPCFALCGLCPHPSTSTLPEL